MKYSILIVALALTVSATTFANTRSSASTEATSGKVKSFDIVPFNHDIVLDVAVYPSMSIALNDVKPAIFKEPVFIENTPIFKTLKTPEVAEPIPVPIMYSDGNKVKNDKILKTFDIRPQKN